MTMGLKSFRAIIQYTSWINKLSYKFGSLTDTGGEEFMYGNLFRHEVQQAWSRVTIASTDHHIPLMLDIAKRWSGPFGILYVLTVSRLGHVSARYQSPEPCTFDDLEIFARKFQDYFEGDGRHDLWFIDVATGSQLIYDKHNLIYSYGSDDIVISLLKSKGFKEGDAQIPCPHEHCYNQEFDMSEDEIMKYFEWIQFPLQNEHDEP